MTFKIVLGLNIEEGLMPSSGHLQAGDDDEPCAFLTDLGKYSVEIEVRIMISHLLVVHTHTDRIPRLFWILGISILSY